MKFTLFIPTKNEIEGVKVIMPKIKKEWVDEIIIIDGNSTDGTAEYLESHGYKVITQKTPGAIFSFWEGFEAATGDVIIPFSPDGNSIPELIPVLINKMKEGYDMVIASRYKDGAKSYDDNFITAFGNFMFTKLINFLFGGNYTDTLVMYRAFKKELLKTLEINKNKYSLFDIVLSIRCAKKKLKVAEIPGDEPPRIDGQDSRVHQGLLGKFRGGMQMVFVIVKELFNWS